MHDKTGGEPPGSDTLGCWLRSWRKTPPESRQESAPLHDHALHVDALPGHTLHGDDALGQDIAGAGLLEGAAVQGGEGEGEHGGEGL